MQQGRLWLQDTCSMSHKQSFFPARKSRKSVTARKSMKHWKCWILHLTNCIIDLVCRDQSIVFACTKSYPQFSQWCHQLCECSHTHPRQQTTTSLSAACNIISYAFVYWRFLVYWKDEANSSLWCHVMALFWLAVPSQNDCIVPVQVPQFYSLNGQLLYQWCPLCLGQVDHC